MTRRKRGTIVSSRFRSLGDDRRRAQSSAIFTPQIAKVGVLSGILFGLRLPGDIFPLVDRLLAAGADQEELTPRYLGRVATTLNGARGG